MAWWIWALIGGGLGLLSMVGSPLRLMQVLQAPHPFQGLAFAFIFGALVPGTVLWLVLTVWLRVL